MSKPGVLYFFKYLMMSLIGLEIKMASEEQITLSDVCCNRSLLVRPNENEISTIQVYGDGW